MNPANQTLGIGAAMIAFLVMVGHAQAPQGERAGGPPAAGRGRAGGPAVPPLIRATPKPAIANAKPVRSCESLASGALPSSTIESAAVDPNDPGVCRVTAVTTRPPAGDKVRIWVAIPTTDWNGRFLGTGGGETSLAVRGSE